jgi:hypothetical protein
VSLFALQEIYRSENPAARSRYDKSSQNAELEA